MCVCCYYLPRGRRVRQGSEITLRTVVIVSVQALSVKPHSQNAKVQTTEPVVGATEVEGLGTTSRYCS